MSPGDVSQVPVPIPDKTDPVSDSVAVRWRTMVVAGLASLVILVELCGRVAYGGTQAIERTAGEHHRRSALVRVEEFLRDGQNLVRGGVFRPDGAPVTGATVRVFDTVTLLGALPAAAEGEWPDLRPEAEMRVADDGSFEARDLSYGSKYVVASSPGCATAVRRDVIHTEGVACEVNFVLQPVQTASGLLLLAENEPMSGLPVCVLPAAWGQRPLQLQSNHAGRVDVPSEYVAEGVVLALVGSPPVAVACDSATAFDSGVTLPPRRQLELTIRSSDGPFSGEVELTFYPESALRAGAEKRRVAVVAGRVLIPDVLLGQWYVAVEGDGQRGWARIDSEAESNSIALARPRPLEVRVSGLRKRAPPSSVPGRVVWHPVPIPPQPDFLTAPHTWLDRRRVVSMAAELADHGAFSAADVADVFGAGRLTVVPVGGWPTTVAAVAAEDHMAAVPLAAGRRITVVAPRSYMPVVIKAGGAVSRGRATAAREAYCWVPEGPVVVRTGLPKGGESRPRGVWAGAPDTSEIRFSRLDRMSEHEHMVCGFARDPESNRALGGSVALTPVTTTDVASSRRVVRVDANGFYQFRGVEPGPYVLGYSNQTDAVGEEFVDYEARLRVTNALLRHDIAAAPGEQSSRSDTRPNGG